LEHRPDIDGPGFVFASEAGIAGVDLDECRDPETGTIDDWAAQIIARFSSYTEISPTDTGVKIFVRGTLLEGERNRSGHVEIYDRGRYFTLTGNRLPGMPSTLEERQTELQELQRSLEPDARSNREALPGAGNQASLSDLDLIDKAKNARDGNKFARLWSGDISGYPSHSEADLALCDLLAFWTGPDPAHIDTLFRQSGLFRDKWERQDYRGKTIEKALAGRTEFYSPPNGQAHNSDATASNGTGHESSEDAATRPSTPSPDARSFTNYRRQIVRKDDKVETIKIGLPVTALGQALATLTRGWPKRVDFLLFVPAADHTPLWLNGADEVFAWIGQQLCSRDENVIRWAKGEDKVGRSEFVAHLRQSAEAYQAVEPFPHEPPMPRTYYMHEQPHGSNGTALRELVHRFNPLTLVDGDLIQAFFLSLFWGGPGGQRPAWLVTTDDESDPLKGRGSGKSALAKMGAHLVGGLIQASPREDMARLITRLLTPGARSRRVVLLDNIKSLKFSWAELEALITSDVISGHQMYEGEGQRPNWLTWCLTINGASLSRDMAQRTVVIKIERPEYSATWEQETRSLIDGKRWEIVGDCLAILKQPAATLRRYSRWAAWEAGVLSHVADPSECQKVIGERQEAMDDDAGEAAVVREAFVAELTSRGYVPDEATVWISAEQAAEIVNRATGEKYPTNRAGVYLRTLAIGELRKSDVNGRRGWAWRGKGTHPSDHLTPL
jgi:hypothetical protein